MMENNFFDISQLRYPIEKNEKFLLPEFLIKENDIGKLFLMRLQVYSDFCRGLWLSDNSRIEIIKEMACLQYLQDTLTYKLALSKNITDVMRLNNTQFLQHEYKSYINSLILNANEKSILYSIFDNRLFCYYVWAHTLKIKKIGDSEKGFYFPNEAVFSEGINIFAFEEKIAMFHEQRKLIVIFELERNIDRKFKLQKIKHNWLQICKHSFIVKLNENDPEFVEWVLQYTINFIETDKIYNDFNNEVSSLFYQQMVTVKDKIETCYTLMHCFIFNDDRYLFEFKRKINLAIAQQEKRNRAKKESSSIKLSKKHEEKLKELAKYQKLPKKQLLESLIDHYYDGLTK